MKSFLKKFAVQEGERYYMILYNLYTVLSTKISFDLFNLKIRTNENKGEVIESTQE